ncbi:MAG: hypothetical protein F6K25_24930 [Okeania sp. SIO2G4]|uniref:hypothetical protein n=1 Tax=unclassified Okeania TaxID=2634635 RepID=UPI0013BE69EC|nr:MULTISPECIES: hypothetical protein [unclassified Okeania]NEP05692.1 hypothetical protein [Okeania sp. SIO4D6]NEP38512.1 hypothetical protein [Okeania sp. SIO2H7]NEP74916.1 hypothetical protein [Okeania sp. SIO2G5]NEP96001.1 hypothetical protein [Okeania sp. SIO2F5]NEQ93721.1 hypothetical protein [Okeania sp. SIO2G4]
MSKTHLWQEEIVEANGLMTISVTIENPQQNRQQLWYRIPTNYRPILTSSCDPFVIAIIFLAMNQGTDLMVHGEVSPSLLRNLEEFQIIWSAWKPEQYNIIQINAETEKEQETILATEKAISAFSGGVDSCFTAFRHSRGNCGRQKRNLKAGLMVHGFDIPVEQEEIFSRAAQKSQIMLSSLGMELIPIATNFRKVIKLNWEDVFGTAIASCLNLVKKGYNTGLIPASYAYRDITLPYGSNPVTDPLLSSKSFTIIYDGGKFGRLEKIKEIYNWDEALVNLRVCWQGEQKDRNCGRCEKCIRNILNFRALGYELPPCFPKDVTNKQIANLKLRGGSLDSMEHILKLIKINQISGFWIKVLQATVLKNRILINLEKMIPDSGKEKLRQLKFLLNNNLKHKR